MSKSALSFFFCAAFLWLTVGEPGAAGKGRAGARPASPAPVESGVIWVKFKSSAFAGKPSASSRLNALYTQFQVTRVEPSFEHLLGSSDPRARELGKIYVIRFLDDRDPYAVAEEFARLPEVEYAEPNYIYNLYAEPNDSLYSQQSYLKVVNLPQAWDLVKGEDGNVVVAVIDGGTDWTHPDLQANIWNNEDEIPGNGVDDDNNGFVDDIRGWNYASNSNDPRGDNINAPQNYNHGTHTAGIVSAVTNNEIGVAGASWNAKVMPINASFPDKDNSISGIFGYQGIVYAADNGASIISLSWGNNHPPSRIHQEIIDYAYAKGALVVAAAGNNRTNNDENPHFPSNYDHVLSVGNIDNVGLLSQFSNYGVSVDVFAPGMYIMSTIPDGDYARFSGTSMSTPLVAGIAALLKTLRPELNVDQIRERIRVTAQSIDDINSAEFAGKLGKGKVLADAALTREGIPAVRVVDSRFEDANGDRIIEPREQVTLEVAFTNYLADASDIQFRLSSDNIIINIKNGSASLPQLAGGDTARVQFSFEIKENIKEGETLLFFVDISAGDYQDRDLIYLVANPPQVANHSTGILQTSITAQGNIGFTGFSGESPGVGFVFRGSNYLFEGGLMVGTSTATVSDCIRGADGQTQDDDFLALAPIALVSPGDIADEEGEIVLVDSFASQPLGVEIVQKSYAYTTDPFNGFVIFRYLIKNRSSKTLTNFRVGLFFDWDINENANDFARFDAIRGMGYVQNYRINPNKIAATRVLTPPGATAYRSIHNPDDIYGGPGRNGFTDYEKWTFLSDSIQTTTIDTTDVSTLISSGPFVLEPDATIEVAFAVIGANSLQELFRNADLAQFLWDNNLIPELNNRPAHTSTLVFQNPAATKYADIVVVSDLALKEPPEVDVWTDGDTTRVEMKKVLQETEVYRGRMVFSKAGTYTIRTRSVALINNADTTQERSFAVTLAKPQLATSVQTTDRQATLFIPARAIEAPTYFMADVVQENQQTVYRFGPARTFTTPLTLEIKFDPDTFSQPEKIFAFRRSGTTWEKLPTAVLLQSRTVKLQVQQLGDFKLQEVPDFSGSNLVPEAYALRQNYPNPFNPSTTIEYDIPESAEVTLTVYNALGQVVRTLYRGKQQAGRYRIIWDGRDEHGGRVASGIYFYQLKAGAFSKVRKMIFIQ